MAATKGGYCLFVTMFDGFTIKNEFHEFKKEAKRARRVSTLIEYLIANRDTKITKARLIEALWPDEESDNPDGALRNLVYRARTEMKKFFPGLEVDCILLQNDAYVWNPDVEMQADIDAFESLHAQALMTDDMEEKYELIRQLIDIYKGEFLPEASDANWVMFKAMYYRRRYVDAVLVACEYLMRNDRFDEVLALCERAVQIEQVNEKLHEFYLRALDALDETQRAMEYYYYVVDLFYSKLGMDVSESMREIYQTIIEKLPEYQVDMNKLEDRLRDTQSADGSYYCNYEVFKSIYQVNVRSLRRSRNSKFLVLLTLEAEDAAATTGETYMEEMKMLHEVIRKVLRRNDVFTQFSATQYSIIISAPNMDSSTKAIHRITERFEAKNKIADIQLSWDIKEIQ